MFQTALADGSHGTAGLAAEPVGSVQTVGLQLLTQAEHELLRVDLGKAQIDDALNAEGQTEHQRQGDERHEAGVALDELGLDHLVESGGVFLAFVECAHVHVHRCRGRVHHSGVSLQGCAVLWCL